MKEESNKKIEEKISIEFPWKKVIWGEAFVVVLVILLGFINNLSRDYFSYNSLINLFNKLNLPFTPLQIGISIAILLLLILGIWVFIKKRKNKEDLKNSSEKEDSSTKGLNELHNEEEELKRKLHEIRSKSFELAKKSKDEKAREHHNKFKGEINKPILFSAFLVFAYSSVIFHFITL